MSKRTVMFEFDDDAFGLRDPAKPTLSDDALLSDVLHFLWGGASGRGMRDFGQITNVRLANPTPQMRPGRLLEQPEHLRAPTATVSIHIAPPPAGMVQEVVRVGACLSIVTRSA